MTAVYKCTERYATGWTDPRGVFGGSARMPRFPDYYGITNMKKVDDHKYVTEAKDLPIEACVSMWVIKYGDGPVPAMETTEQEPLMWEIGNRLWWANRLKHNKPEDTYEIID